MFEYYNNILCVQGGWLYGDGNILSESNYKLLNYRGFIQVIRRGCKGNPALVKYDSLPDRFRKVIVEKFGDPKEKVKQNLFEDEIIYDPEAATFFDLYRLTDGRELKDWQKFRYRSNAEVLNAIDRIVTKSVARRGALGGKTKGIWDKVSDLVYSLDKTKYPHNLPSGRRLQERYKRYKKEGYSSLVSKKFNNNNSRKVNADLERLILSIYCMPEKPYNSTTHDIYMQFLGGAIDVVDISTAELFDRDDFYDSKDRPITLHESTIYNVINDPKNRILVDKSRLSELEFNNVHRPHHHRVMPNFSLSKISMDDRDLPRKMHNGKRVKAYYAYDIMSGCVIGASYSHKKDNELFIDCMRNMFRNLNTLDLGMPMEVEVEHHLVNNYKDDLMKAGNVFQFVRWSNPGNPQEKWAETGHRRKKYGYEKRNQHGIGRFYAKLEANRTNQEKIFDAENDNYKEDTFTYDQIVADDWAVIQKYNNALHRDQKKYPNMTQLEVLQKFANPNLVEYQYNSLAKYIGESTNTSIRRSQYVKANNGTYVLPSSKVMSRLQVNNLEVKAHWLPTQNGQIDKISIYQNDQYICDCLSLEKYNTALGERTDADTEAYKKQSAYVSEFDGMVKAETKRIPKVEIIQNTVDPKTVEVAVVAENKPNTETIIDDYDNDYIDNLALDSL